MREAWSRPGEIRTFRQRRYFFGRASGGQPSKRRIQTVVLNKKTLLRLTFRLTGDRFGGAPPKRKSFLRHSSHRVAEMHGVLVRPVGTYSRVVWEESSLRRVARGFIECTHICQPDAAYLSMSAVSGHCLAARNSKMYPESDLKQPFSAEVNYACSFLQRLCMIDTLDRRAGRFL